MQYTGVTHERGNTLKCGIIYIFSVCQAAVNFFFFAPFIILCVNVCVYCIILPKDFFCILRNQPHDNC